MKRLVRAVQLLVITAAVLVFIALAYSVVQSGYHYQFDIDEFFYAQYTYLYTNGYRPYLDVYTTLYPPVFHWITSPVFRLTGFTFDGLYAARYFMIVLFIIRVTSLWMAMKLIFNKRTAFLFLPLYLLDPLAVFTSMQYRPDNLMLTLFAAGFLLLTQGFIKRNIHRIALSGFLLGFAVLVLAKITPTIIVIGVLFGIYCLIHKRMGDFVVFVIAGAIAPLLFCLYLITQGALTEMIQQMFIEAKLLYTNFQYPIPINALLKPDNIFIYGTMGKPPSWVYSIMLAPIGFAGLFQLATHTAGEANASDKKVWLRSMLALALIGQWSTLFVLQVAFMQHYMPVNWLHAVFGAYAIDTLLTTLNGKRLARAILVAILFTLYLIVGITSIKHNLFRAKIDAQGEMKEYEARWKQIPPTEKVFPSYLFRPPTYPLPYGGFIINLPDPVIKRLPDIVTMLETQKPRLLLDDYTLFRLPNEAQQYINAHYERVAGDKELMVWKQ